MKLVYLLLLVLLSQSLLLASSDIYTRVIELNGLPLHLADGLQINLNENDVNEYGSIDMAPYFESMGVNVPKGCMIIYNASSRGLVARLSEQDHLLLDTALTYLYRHDNLLAITKAYLDQLLPLSDKERLTKVLSIGFMPDPLISSLISKIKKVEQSLIEASVAKELFPDENSFPQIKKSIDKATRKKIETRSRLMKKQLSKLLEISLQRLSEELIVLESSKVDGKNE
ncbi:MAG: hypothetical protein L3J39_10960 [Verrucomicrobiales bacterium]|nr:hypothetical protein [Verrucomicrobiales bacterium]